MNCDQGYQLLPFMTTLALCQNLVFISQSLLQGKFIFPTILTIVLTVTKYRSPEKIIWDNETTRLQETRKTTAKMGGLSAERSKKDRRKNSGKKKANNREWWKKITKVAVQQWQMTSLTITKRKREEEHDRDCNTLTCVSSRVLEAFCTVHLRRVLPSVIVHGTPVIDHRLVGPTPSDRCRRRTLPSAARVRKCHRLRYYNRRFQGSVEGVELCVIQLNYTTKFRMIVTVNTVMCQWYISTTHSFATSIYHNTNRQDTPHIVIIELLFWYVEYWF